jgi:hypothetical protein
MNFALVKRRILPFSIIFILLTQMPRLWLFILPFICVALLFLIIFRKFTSKSITIIKFDLEKMFFLLSFLYGSIVFFNYFATDNQESYLSIKLNRVISLIDRSVDIKRKSLSRILKIKKSNVTDQLINNRFDPGKVFFAGNVLAFKKTFSEEFVYNEKICTNLKSMLFVSYPIDFDSSVEKIKKGEENKIVFFSKIFETKKFANRLMGKCPFDPEEKSMVAKILEPENYFEPSIHDKFKIERYQFSNKRKLYDVQVAFLSKALPLQLHQNDLILMYNKDLSKDNCKLLFNDVFRQISLLVIPLIMSPDLSIVSIVNSSDLISSTGNFHLGVTKDGNELVYEFSSPPSPSLKICSFYIQDYLIDSFEYLEATND